MGVWRTTQEVAEHLGISRQAVDLRALEQQWRRPEWEGQYWRRREEAGGGFEYHRLLLPERASTEAGPVVVEGLPEAGKGVVTALTARANRRMDAKLAILEALERFIASSKLGQTIGEEAFVRIYNSDPRLLGAPDEVLMARKEISLATLRRWRKEKQDLGIAVLAGRYAPRRGADIWSGCEPLRTLVIGLITSLPHAGGKMARDLALARLGERVEVADARTGEKKGQPLPSERSFQRFIQQFKSDNKVLFARATHPDRYKNAYRMAAGRMYDDIVRRNQLWEMDASPVDCLCVDGRFSMYVMVDIHSRWPKARLTRTPKSAAALLLLRDCMLDWGVPEELVTDNGSDFTSKYFMDVMRRLGVKQRLCDPGQPQQKAAVERAIGTIQHTFMEMQPGYIGHSVSDRKQIEARRSFLARLGQSEDKMFCVDLTRDELQARLDGWIGQKWVFEPHEGLSGKTPFEVRTAWRGPVARIEGEGVLEHLLAPPADGKGTRIVTAKGIRIQNIDYHHGALGLLVGQEVHVRLDPDDLGRIHVYRGEPWEFVCLAINPERAGVSRAEVAAKVRERQKQLLDEAMVEVKSAQKVINVRTMSEEIVADAARRNGRLVAFPAPSTTHATPDIAAAIEAVNAKSGKAVPEVPLTASQQAKLLDIREHLAKTPEPVRDEAAIRYANACALEARLAAGETLEESEMRRLRHYQESSEYKAKKRLERFYRQA